MEVVLRFHPDEATELADWLEYEFPYDAGAMGIVRAIRAQLPKEDEQ